jgi:hypothetical protein
MRPITTLIITGSVAFAAVSGSAAAQDLRSPDARTGMQPAGESFVSPDARDSARGPRSTYSVGEASNTTRTDLRSPDAKDAARRVVVTYEPGAVEQPGTQVIQLAGDGGFKWGDAGIGAAGMLALVALIGGTLLIASHRRHQRGFPIATR